MHWFVPTHGDQMFLGVEAKSLADLETSSRRLSALTGRLSRGVKNDLEARAIGQDLAEHGALSEPPETLDQLTSAVVDDPAFAEAASALGLENPYRPARPEEIRELQAFPLRMWPNRLHEGGMN